MADETVLREAAKYSHAVLRAHNLSSEPRSLGMEYAELQLAYALAGVPYPGQHPDILDQYIANDRKLPEKESVV